MLINDVNLDVYGVKLYDRVITSNKIDTVDEWLDGDIQPTFVRQQDRFKDMTLSFLALTKNEQEAFVQISRLTQALKKATLKFDDMSLLFDVAMVGEANPVRLKNGNFIVTYNFKSDYARGEREVYTTDANSLNSFKLTVLYYQNNTVLLATETVDIRASKFEGVGDTLAKIGIDVDKYRPSYYEAGVATNLGGDLSYESLLKLQVLIINYVPSKFNVEVRYYYNAGSGVYQELAVKMTQFTHDKVVNAQTIGQVIDFKLFRPDGCRTWTDFTGELTVEGILSASPINIFYDVIEAELNKTVTLAYKSEDDRDGTELIETQVLIIKESDFYDGITYKDLFNIDKHRPSVTYYNSGVLKDLNADDLITFNDLKSTYEIIYYKTEIITYVEYYAGIYPNWYRISSIPVKSKIFDSLLTNFRFEDMGIDVNRYHTYTYQEGKVFNADQYATYDDVISAGIIQIYYEPIDFTIKFEYYKDKEKFAEKEMKVNELTFFSNPTLNDLADIIKRRPEGWQLDTANTYNGNITLSDLVNNSPIRIYYEEIAEVRVKNVIVKYRERLASGLVVLNTSLIVVNEPDTIGGVRLRDIISIDAYRPDYYEPGYVDGYSATALLTFDDIRANYDVIYEPTTYYTPVRYYVDEIDPIKWIGSSNISYRIIDFTTSTTLFDLGLDLNLYKPSYASDGVLHYSGAVNFQALMGIDALNVVYTTIEEPTPDDPIDYPHRFLFLQHNDLGEYEHLHPTWTMNHSFINTGVTVEDMSKLTVTMEVARVDPNVPLHEVIAGYGALFGSASGQGEFYMRFNNQTQYGNSLTGVNTYEAMAGRNTNKLTLTEESAVGFSENTGIYASDRAGYSYATFTYTNNLQTEHVPMPYPLYLFAENRDGKYANGIAGVGIYSCRIYYDNVLLRDFIPVAFYDKIGDKIAPENCLYDKVTQAFYIDGSGTASFNIIDDERYEDHNPEHNIGHCYVNYYKNDSLFQTLTIWFRESDFLNGKIWDPYEKFGVDTYQPQYYYPGTIVWPDNLPVNFDNIKNKTFNVVYKEQTQRITVRWWKDDILLAEEEIPLTEKDFYQAPTFGDIVRLNKYRPKGYETNFEYTGLKVSLARVLAGSPYDIVYVPETDKTKYSFTIRYMKEVFGIRNYQTIAVETITLDAADFRDGEYVDHHVNINLHKPEKYYLPGERYGWYSYDERLTTPDMMKAEYRVLYRAKQESVNVHYYKQSELVHAPGAEGALILEEIAQAGWMVKITDFDPDYEFTIVDMLPNEYMNKFRPVTCYAGQFLHPEKLYDFARLMEDDDIQIYYQVRYEPDSPETDEWEQRVLVWGRHNNQFYANEDEDNLEIGSYLGGLSSEAFNHPSISEELRQDLVSMYGSCYKASNGYIGGRIPYIDLGYTPKQVDRLRVKIKCRAQTEGFATLVSPYAYQTSDYTYFFGYYGPRQMVGIGHLGALDIAQKVDPGTLEFYSNKDTFSPSCAGAFAINTFPPWADAYVHTSSGPQHLDGQIWYTAGPAGYIQGHPTRKKESIQGKFRKGYYHGTDDNWNEYVMNRDYSIQYQYEFRYGDELWDIYDGAMVTRPLSDFTKNLRGCPTAGWAMQNCGLTNPFTITLDAYHGYGEIYTEEYDNAVQYQIFDTTKDDPAFEGRPEVKGSITLFQTRNPETGEMNIMPFNHMTYPYIQQGVTGGMSGTGNPYGSDYTTSETYEQLVVTGVDEHGNYIYERKTFTRNINYANFRVPINPQLSGVAIWSIQIWDRDRLVRDLIPMAKGDKVYDYVAPANGLFDKVTEIFFANSNEGGTYEATVSAGTSDGTGLEFIQGRVTIKPEEVLPLFVIPDPNTYGKCAVNYYDWDNSFIDNKLIDIPTWFSLRNTTLEEVIHFNDMKPDQYHTNGMVDVDMDLGWDKVHKSLYSIYQDGLVNIYYKLKTFTKSIVYYRGDQRVGSRDVFYSYKDLDEAETLEDLKIDVDLYWTEDFQHGRISFDESLIATDNMEDFIDAPAPVVIYDPWPKEERPDLLYVTYYRGGASDDGNLIWQSENPCYLDCNLDAKVLNPRGCIQYPKHYHQAFYEDEDFGYFIPYQVKILNHYCGVYNGPARKYKVLANIVDRDVYTITEERNGWGRLKEYPLGWIDLAMTSRMRGPGQNPAYDIPKLGQGVIEFATDIHLSKLTIDRLWAYCDEYSCWVKCEEISFNQAGRLYNALSVKVVHLDEIDFTKNPKNFEDIGIGPQSLLLRYHDPAPIPFDGPFTYEALSDLHKVDFIYPETIYYVDCIMYDETQSVPVKLPDTLSATYSISDWNPDWDIVIDTSYKYDENGIQIPPTLYRDTAVTLDWRFFFNYIKYQPVGSTPICGANPYPWDIYCTQVSFAEAIIIPHQYIYFLPNFFDYYELRVTKDEGGAQGAVGSPTYSGVWNNGKSWGTSEEAVANGNSRALSYTFCGYPGGLMSPSSVIRSAFKTTYRAYSYSQETEYMHLRLLHRNLERKNHIASSFGDCGIKWGNAVATPAMYIDTSPYITCISLPRKDSQLVYGFLENRYDPSTAKFYNSNMSEIKFFGTPKGPNVFGVKDTLHSEYSSEMGAEMYSPILSGTRLKFIAQYENNVLTNLSAPYPAGFGLGTEDNSGILWTDWIRGRGSWTGETLSTRYLPVDSYDVYLDGKRQGNVADQLTFEEQPKVGCVYGVTYTPRFAPIRGSTRYNWSTESNVHIPFIAQSIPDGGQVLAGLKIAQDLWIDKPSDTKIHDIGSWYIPFDKPREYIIGAALEWGSDAYLYEASVRDEIKHSNQPIKTYYHNYQEGSPATWALVTAYGDDGNNELFIKDNSNKFGWIRKVDIAELRTYPANKSFVVARETMGYSHPVMHSNYATYRYYPGDHLTILYWCMYNSIMGWTGTCWVNDNDLIEI